MTYRITLAEHLLPADTDPATNKLLRRVSAQLSSSVRVLILFCTVSVISACLPKKPVTETPTAAPVKVANVKPRSAAPIVPAPKEMVLMAQTALIKLGYKIGKVDGLWGPRSARAIRKFESEQKIWSANGHISELNLEYLRKVSGVNSVDELPQKTVPSKPEGAKKLGITAKLDKETGLEAGPQLIIVDRAYEVFSKPNPYSVTLTELPAGTGIYIVARESDWYEIESLDQIKGYVPVD